VRQERERERSEDAYLLKGLVVSFVVRHGGPMKRLFGTRKERVEGRGDVKRMENEDACGGEKSKLPNRFQSPTHIPSGKTF
jgi:hypothetical protein